MAVGVQPERYWHIGDQRPKTKIVEKENGWLFASGAEESASLEKHLEALLEKLHSVSAGVASVAVKANIEVSCAIYSENQPAISIGADIVRRVADLHAGLDIDVYVIAPDTD